MRGLDDGAAARRLPGRGGLLQPSRGAASLRRPRGRRLLAGCESFRAAAESVASGAADLALLPIENSTAGSHRRDLRPARGGRAGDHRRGGLGDRALPARAARLAARGDPHGPVAPAGAASVRPVLPRASRDPAARGVRHRRRRPQGARAGRPDVAAVAGAVGRRRLRARDRLAADSRMRPGTPRASSRCRSGRRRCRRARGRGLRCSLELSDRPGALAELLAEFGRRGLNLTEARVAARSPRRRSPTGSISTSTVTPAPGRCARRSTRSRRGRAGCDVLGSATRRRRARRRSDWRFGAAALSRRRGAWSRRRRSSRWRSSRRRRRPGPGR